MATHLYVFGDESKDKVNELMYRTVENKMMIVYLDEFIKYHSHLLTESIKTLTLTGIVNEELNVNEYINSSNIMELNILSSVLGSIELGNNVKKLYMELIVCNLLVYTNIKRKINIVKSDIKEIRVEEEEKEPSNILPIEKETLTRDIVYSRLLSFAKEFPFEGKVCDNGSTTLLKHLFTLKYPKESKFISSDNKKDLYEEVRRKLTIETYGYENVYGTSSAFDHYNSINVNKDNINDYITPFYRLAVKTLSINLQNVKDVQTMVNIINKFSEYENVRTLQLTTDDSIIFRDSVSIGNKSDVIDFSEIKFPPNLKTLSIALGVFNKVLIDKLPNSVERLTIYLKDCDCTIQNFPNQLVNLTINTMRGSLKINSFSENLVNLFIEKLETSNDLTTLPSLPESLKSIYITDGNTTDFSKMNIPAGVNVCTIFASKMDNLIELRDRVKDSFTTSISTCVKTKYGNYANLSISKKK